MILEKLVRRALHLGFLVTRPMTLGVRVAAFDEKGCVFLVRHTYVAGWYLPGGGVDPGETAREAAIREIAEEGNLRVRGGLDLVSVHFNRRQSRRDHVIFYRTGDVVQERAKESDREIAKAGFFSPAALPDGTTRATRRRLAELSGESAADPYW